MIDLCPKVLIVDYNYPDLLKLILEYPFYYPYQYHYRAQNLNLKF